MRQKVFHSYERLILRFFLIFVNQIYIFSINSYIFDFERDTSRNTLKFFHVYSEYWGKKEWTESTTLLIVKHIHTNRDTDLKHIKVKFHCIEFEQKKSIFSVIFKTSTKNLVDFTRCVSLLFCIINVREEQTEREKNANHTKIKLNGNRNKKRRPLYSIFGCLHGVFHFIPGEHFCLHFQATSFKICFQ